MKRTSGRCVGGTYPGLEAACFGHVGQMAAVRGGTWGMDRRAARSRKGWLTHVPAPQISSSSQPKVTQNPTLRLTLPAPPSNSDLQGQLKVSMRAASTLNHPCPNVATSLCSVLIPHCIPRLLLQQVLLLGQLRVCMQPPTPPTHPD